MIYLDTSFIAPLVVPEVSSAAVEAYLQRSAREAGSPFISLWTQVEFASLVARRLRMREISERDASAIRDVFAQTLVDSFTVLVPAADDFLRAEEILRKPRTGLRGGDALHLAIAANHGAETFLTLDTRLIAAGRMLKLPVKRGIRG